MNEGLRPRDSIIIIIITIVVVVRGCSLNSVQIFVFVTLLATYSVTSMLLNN